MAAVFKAVWRGRDLATTRTRLLRLKSGRRAAVSARGRVVWTCRPVRPCLTVAAIAVVLGLGLVFSRRLVGRGMLLELARVFRGSRRCGGLYFRGRGFCRRLGRLLIHDLFVLLRGHRTLSLLSNRADVSLGAAGALVGRVPERLDPEAEFSCTGHPAVGLFERRSNSPRHVVQQHRAL